MSRLSEVEGERRLQQYILVMVGWLILSIVIVAAPLLWWEIADQRRGLSESGFPLVTLRAALGVVMVLLSCLLPVLARRHREAIARVGGLRRQYRNAAFVNLFFGTAGIVWFWWVALGAVVTAVVALVLTLRIRPRPSEQVEERIQHVDPLAWNSSGSSRRPWVAPVVTFVLVLLAVVAIVLAELLVTGPAGN